MRTYKVVRQFISPRREGDTPDLVEVPAESKAEAIQGALQALQGKPGTYQV